MTLKEFIKENTKTYTNKEVKFSLGKLKDGNSVVIASSSINDKPKMFVLEGSLNNFQRFKNWIGKETNADFKPTGKFIKVDGKRLPIIQIRVSSSNNSDEEETGDNEENNKDNDITF